MTQLVVTVPGDTKDGVLLVSYGGTDSMEIKTVDTLKILMPAISNMTPNPADTGKNLIITGTNLDLVKSITFAGVTSPVTNFVNQSATQLTVVVPDHFKRETTFGIKNSTLTVQSPVEKSIPLHPLPILSRAALYTDGILNGFQDWSYTDTHDNSTEMVRQGTNLLKQHMVGMDTRD
jgi:hypothetical protein